eukprot:CAMPEP_0185716990 /NCGR_PEP_ID=MMETSP1164-20130828/43959_1 /TAXON_ID=1104430 /ORGANISM="Chrysoreinhardia sp, Strain CCMP2950" /LENGTH=438 /DNA_ID=CAMNT_0028384625 /DNA_START=30 /DNA_END=1346 /DNA_ORIENTATION=-
MIAADVGDPDDASSRGAAAGDAPTKPPRAAPERPHQQAVGAYGQYYRYRRAHEATRCASQTTKKRGRADDIAPEANDADDDGAPSEEAPLTESSSSVPSTTTTSSNPRSVATSTGDAEDHNTASLTSRASSASPEDRDDPRLRFLDAAWFAGAKVKDVGCNSGELSVGIAKRFAPRMLVGVDVDAQRISEARALVARLASRAADDLIAATRRARSLTSSAADGPPGVLALGPLPFPHNLWFEVEDFARGWDDEEENHGDNKKSDVDKTSTTTARPEEEEPTSSSVGAQGGVPKEGGGEDHSYDVVCAFSVTKWVHLAHGDAGIRRFFARALAALKPGGRLVYEPQEWRSYRRAKHKCAKHESDTIRHNFATIKLRPADFAKLLVDDIGFERVDLLGTPRDPGLPKGFQRPIYCAYKRRPASSGVSSEGDDPPGSSTRT